MELNDLFSAVLAQAMPAILTAIAGFAAFLGKKFVGIYADNKNAAKIERGIKLTIDYVNQLAKNAGWDNAKKKEEAIKMATDYFKEQKLPIGAVTLELMIEAFVNGAKTADAIVDDAVKSFPTPELSLNDLGVVGGEALLKEAQGSE